LAHHGLIDIFHHTIPEAVLGQDKVIRKKIEEGGA